MKLVRDGYGSREGFATRPVESREEHVLLLAFKISEESGELLLASDPGAAAIEAGDLIEVVLAYCQVRFGLTEEVVMTARRRKSDALGGFTMGIVRVDQ